MNKINWYAQLIIDNKNNSPTVGAALIVFLARARAASVAQSQLHD